MIIIIIMIMIMIVIMLIVIVAQADLGGLAASRRLARPGSRGQPSARGSPTPNQLGDAEDPHRPQSRGLPFPQPDGSPEPDEREEDSRPHDVPGTGFGAGRRDPRLRPPQKTSVGPMPSLRTPRASPHPDGSPEPDTGVGGRKAPPSLSDERGVGPTSLLRIFLLRLLDSNFPEISLWT